ncbi:hypothetical protein MBLNU230_g3663t1 [Neophaeotheca triangularis]
MSRRPPDRTEQNRATLKQLVKLEANKSCADCKRNKHPRWASWNLGIFMCIRCSGIHRGMGTHISRVKSVDLDSWTDEQMANMLKWGNARANKYWENKLAEGHVPSESKIENFIRTKYDSKRWVMDGPIPDPATLDTEGDDDVPLNVVREKASIERSASLRNGTASSGPRGSLPGPPQAPRPQEVDLFGDTPGPSLARPNTTEPAVRGVPPPSKAPAAAPKQTKPGESLLGLDFFGGTSSAPPARPSSAASGGGSTPGVPGRTDLKQSILSLYSSAPRQSSAPQSQQSSSNAFGGMTGMQSPPVTSPMQQQSNAQSLAGMNDAFGGLSFASPPPQQQKQDSFANLTSPSHNRQPSAQKANALSGGSFFDVKPALPLKPTSPPSKPAATAFSNDWGNDFGDFTTAPAPPTTTKSPPPTQKPSNVMDSLFDMSAPAPPPKTSPAPTATASKPPPISATNYSQASSAFNLSQPAPKPAPAPAQPTTTTASSSAFSGLSNMDAWGSNDAWSTPDPPAPSNPSVPKATPASPPKPAAPAMQTPFDAGGWGDAPASSSAGGVSVQQDEEFGAWGHASPIATTSSTSGGNVGGNKSAGTGAGGFAGQDDLFGNVWG